MENTILARLAIYNIKTLGNFGITVEKNMQKFLENLNNKFVIEDSF